MFKYLIFYLISCTLFIYALSLFSSPKTAKNGNIIGIFGMILVIMPSLVFDNKYFYLVLLCICLGAIVGIFFAIKIRITDLPEMIAVFNGFGGAATTLVSLGEVLENNSGYLQNSFGLTIGALTFSGSITAFLKLRNIISSRSIFFRGQHVINLVLLFVIILFYIPLVTFEDIKLFYIMGIMAFLLGILLLLPIGGADMPIVIAVLNACSGFASLGLGFVLKNVALVIIGTLVGVSGIFLSRIMTKSMNRSIINVLIGNIFLKNSAKISTNSTKLAKETSPQNAAFILGNSANIIIVVGYGLAVAQAQHFLNRLVTILENVYHCNVSFAIHPVAGRMPGHMNVLLAEADIDYNKVFPLEDINPYFGVTDTVLVIGANDIVNPGAVDDLNNPLFGMSVLEVWKAKTVLVIKRSLSYGYANVDNPLFYMDNVEMVYGDAKDVLQEIIKNLSDR